MTITGMDVNICICVHIFVHTYTCVNVHRHRESENDRERKYSLSHMRVLPDIYVHACITLQACYTNQRASNDTYSSFSVACGRALSQPPRHSPTVTLSHTHNKHTHTHTHTHVLPHTHTHPHLTTHTLRLTLTCHTHTLCHFCHAHPHSQSYPHPYPHSRPIILSLTHAHACSRSTVLAHAWRETDSSPGCYNEIPGLVHTSTVASCDITSSMAINKNRSRFQPRLNLSSRNMFGIDLISCICT